MLHQQTQHVESMIKLRLHVNTDKFPRRIDVFF